MLSWRERFVGLKYHGLDMVGQLLGRISGRSVILSPIEGVHTIGSSRVRRRKRSMS